MVGRALAGAGHAPFAPLLDHPARTAAQPGRALPQHEALLAGAATDIKAVHGEAALLAIIAVAEAFSGTSIGMPSWLRGAAAQ